MTEQERAAALADEIEKHDKLAIYYAGDGCNLDNGEKDMIVSALRAYARPAPGDLREAVRVRHVKRGSTYRVIGEAVAQVSTGEVGEVRDAHKSRDYIYRKLSDGCRLTVYLGEADGKLWARPTDEFEDGRFELLDRAKEG